MTRILLTGAGFSRNWGGWLADEAFEYLLGCTDEVDQALRERLWRSRRQGGGFEDALAELQDEHARGVTHSSGELTGLQAALVRMFNEMDQGFADTRFEQHNDMRYQLAPFLTAFDAIFTLNQDLLLERHYLNDNIGLSRRWSGWQMPGLKLLYPPAQAADRLEARLAMRTPDPSQFQEHAGAQPYFKLHGSSNWMNDTSGERLLVMGGNKALEINRYPLLRWYHEQFRTYLGRPDARLMVVGYSFGDSHINQAIMEAADKGSLRLFIVDPRGVDVLDKQNPRAPLRVPGDLMNRLNPHIVGASRRSLSTTFGNDRVEYGKLSRFVV